ncbi:MAG: CCA tRNA nucleotidyltransferase [Lentisphaerae bacterium]|nr:CCA tRNA nucleotidyltransferase [Lentisphaerota bacterium]
MNFLPPNSSEYNSAIVVATRLKNAGFEALLAGGCVRDMIMGRVPRDYDIATNANVDDTLELFPDGITVGKAFGVIRIKLNNFCFEIASFREDHDYTDGRRPGSITFTDAKNDALRRDFTVNALFYDPFAEEIRDYVGGYKDIQNKVIRAVGDPDKRFNEDYLRMMRAVRFSGVLGFEINPSTLNALKTNAYNIAKISKERVRDELTLTLTESLKPGRTVELLQEIGLLKEILPEVSATKGQEQPPEFHPEGDVFEHTVMMLDMMEKKPSLQLAYSVLFHDIGKPPTAKMGADRLRFDGHASVGAKMAVEIMKRLKFSNADTKTIAFCVENHMRFMDVRKMRRSTLHRLIAAPTFDIELELHKLDCLASHGKLLNYNFLIQAKQSFKAKPSLPKPLVTGEDIIALGIPEGKEVGKWKALVFEAQLEGYFTDRNEALEWVKQQREKNTN